MQDKEIVALLQVCLWRLEGMPEQELYSKFECLVNPKVVLQGIKFVEYLKGV